MKFAEFTVGRVIETASHDVTESEILEFAARYDPQWFHTDPEAAANGRFGGLIGSGWMTCAIAMRLMVDAAFGGSESFASPGLKELKWLHPVRPGDTLRVRADILGNRISKSSPDMGIVQMRWVVINQQHIKVMEVEATNLFELKSGN